MDYNEFLVNALEGNEDQKAKLPFLVLGADYRDSLVARKLDPHLLALRQITSALKGNSYGNSIDHIYLTLRVDGQFVNWNLAGVFRVRLMSKLKYLRCDVHFLNPEIMQSTPKELSLLFSNRVIQAASACLDRLERTSTEFDRMQFQEDLQKSIHNLSRQSITEI